MSLLETKAGKIGTTGRTVWSGLFDALPDLTNREQSIFADTEGNVFAEVVLSGTLAKEFAGMMSPNRYYVIPHTFILKIGGDETRIQRNSVVLRSSKSLVISSFSRICSEQSSVDGFSEQRDYE